MSFSFSMEDKKGNDLLKKYGIHDQLLGVAPNGSDAMGAPYDLDQIRAVIGTAKYGKDLPAAARDAWNEVRAMVAANRDHFAGPEHPECPSCKCKRPQPQFWFDVDDMEKLLAVPVNEIHRLWGGW